MRGTSYAICRGRGNERERERDRERGREGRREGKSAGGREGARKGGRERGRERESTSERVEGKQKEEGGRARGVTGLAGFVKAMHCKELTTTIPFLSPSYPPSCSRSLLTCLSLSFSLSLPSIARRGFLSVSLAVSLRLVFSLLRLFPSLSSRALPSPSSFSSTLRDFSSPLALSLPLSFSLPPCIWAISSFLCRPLVRGGRVGARSLLVHHS